MCSLKTLFSQPKTAYCSLGTPRALSEQEGVHLILLLVQQSERVDLLTRTQC